MSKYGPGAYLRTAREIARSAGSPRFSVLGRMLYTKLVTGVSAFEYGLYGLHSRRMAEVRYYLTKDQTTALFAKVNPIKHRWLVDDKLAFARRCATTGIPTPAVLTVLSKDGRHDGSEPVVRTFEELVRTLADRPRIDLILKPRSDSLGTGVRFVSLRMGEAFDIEDRAVDVEAFATELHLDMQRDQYLVQPFIRPHPALAALGSGRALGTLRALAMRDEPQPRILYALLRIPAAGNVHDNFSAGGSGNLIAGVDPHTGRLSAALGYMHGSGGSLLERFASNPKTGVRIEGVQLPLWHKLEELLSRASAAFPELPCLGWDFAITVEDVLLVEANSNPDMFGGQTATGHGALRLLAPVLERYGVTV